MKNEKKKIKKQVGKAIVKVKHVASGLTDNAKEIPKKTGELIYKTKIKSGRSKSRNKALKKIKDGKEYINDKNNIPKMKEQIKPFVSLIDEIARMVDKYSPQDVVHQCNKAKILCEESDIYVYKQIDDVSLNSIAEECYDEIKGRTIKILDDIISIMEEREKKES